MSRIIKAIAIDTLEPGTLIKIDGIFYTRLQDWPEYHVEGWVVNTKTGWCGSWTRLCLQDKQIEVIE